MRRAGRLFYAAATVWVFPYFEYQSAALLTSRLPLLSLEWITEPSIRIQRSVIPCLQECHQCGFVRRRQIEHPRLAVADTQPSIQRRSWLHAGAVMLDYFFECAEADNLEGRIAGYSRICLDTLPSMSAALSLYQSLGFVAIELFVFKRIAETPFMALSPTS